MNMTSSLVSKIDRDAYRKQILAQVYRLILNFSQDVESKNANLGKSGTSDETIIETALVEAASAQ